MRSTEAENVIHPEHEPLLRRREATDDRRTSSDSLTISRVNAQHAIDGVCQFFGGEVIRVESEAEAFVLRHFAVVLLVSEQRHGEQGHAVVERLQLTIHAAMCDEERRLRVTE